MTDVCTPQAENSAYPTRGVIEAAKVHTAVAKVSIATAEEAIHRAWQMIGVCKAHTADRDPATKKSCARPTASLRPCVSKDAVANCATR